MIYRKGAVADRLPFANLIFYGKAFSIPGWYSQYADPHRYFSRIPTMCAISLPVNGFDGNAHLCESRDIAP